LNALNAGSHKARLLNSNRNPRLLLSQLPVRRDPPDIATARIVDRRRVAAGEFATHAISLAGFASGASRPANSPSIT
jgi:hypothetical protein